MCFRPSITVLQNSAAMNYLLFFTIFMVSNVGASRVCCNSCNTKPNCGSSCRTQCRNVCGNVFQKNCCYQKEKCTTTTTTTTISTPTASTEETTQATPSPERIEIDETESTNQRLVNVHSNNIINNNNQISVNIEVRSNLVNNITGGGGGGGSGVTPEPRVVTRIIPVKVPVCDENCTVTHPTPVTVTSTTPKATRCCVVIKPCVTYGCNPYHYQCGGCHSNYEYKPVNPCHGGCFKRSHWDRQRCYFGNCYTNRLDCQSCHEDFYKTYEGYSRCGGCFYGY